MSFAMPSLSSSDRQAIISFCESHCQAHRRESQPRPVTLNTYAIKYGSPDELCFEHETHRYIHRTAVNDPTAPRVPEVVDYFVTGQNWHGAYLVLEAMINDDAAPEKVAEALRWLASVPAPVGVTLGSVGGGPAYHDLFKDYEAPLRFSSTLALQNYMNKVSSMFPGILQQLIATWIDQRLSKLSRFAAGHPKRALPTKRLYSHSPTWTSGTSSSTPTANYA